MLKIWIKEHKVEFIILFIILIVASVMRLYRISEYMTFLGDEGRDVIIVKRFLTQGDIMLIGPGTSIGNMYLGPLYYYMMAPALFLAGYSPVGPAVMIALLGVLTVWFIWYVGRAWFGPKAGIIAALIYSIAPTIITYSHSSWNPNIMPFFALLFVWSVWKYWEEEKYRWITVTGVSLAFCLQSHYLALLLVPIAGLFFLLTAIKAKQSKKLKKLVLFTLLSAILFALLMSPLAIFDARHNYMNFNAMKAFFTERQSTVSIKPWNALPGMIPQLTLITTRLVTGLNPLIGNWVALLILAGVFFAFVQKRFRVSETSTKGFLLLGAWIGTGLLGLALYKQQIYDHYYGFLFPAFFLVIGGVLSIVWEQHKLRGSWLTLTVVGVLVWANLLASPLQYAPNNQYPRSKNIAQFILKESNGEKFNFAVIAERNYEGAYQYFLQDSPKFTLIEPQKSRETIAPLLFVVCEMPLEKCDPTHNSKTEIANFGWSSIVSTNVVEGVIVFKMVHNYPTPPAKAPIKAKNVK